MTSPPDTSCTPALPASAASSQGTASLLVFTGSMLLSAALLFVVEPMVSKMIMPLLGGTPAIWNTCLVFFQALLLAGYLYAHALLRFLPRPAQIAVHLPVVLSPLLIAGLLPPHLPSGWAPPVAANPTAWLLMLLTVVIGLPFFVLSTNTVVMQRWFADSGHKDAHDPYFLYVASNAGSLVGLFSYPLLLEPLLRIRDQSRLWGALYAVFVAVTALCAALAWRWRNGGASSSAMGSGTEAGPDRISWKTRWHWVALAFVPSSLMLGVTSAITADIPAIPLLWVLPLAVYLITFVLVFAKRPLLSHHWIITRCPLLILLGFFPSVSQTRFSLSLYLLVYLSVLFGLAAAFHGELARTRPAVGRLTEFYFWLSVGGVLGGIFNSLVAPVVFNTVMELPLVLVFAALIRPMPEPETPASDSVWQRRNDVVLPSALLLSAIALILGVARLGIQPGRTETILVFGCPMLWCLTFGKRRTRFVLGMMAILAASYFYAPLGETLVTRRSFFGVYRVRNSPDQNFRLFYHGGVLHGTQSLHNESACEPLAYYTRGGPAGGILKTVQARMPNGNWAVVGLGAGAMASYLQPGQSLTFYEIDPLVAELARNNHYFTYLSRCAPATEIVLGDARLKLRDAPDGHYDLIALDAFSGDSIPVHLITKEALALYLRKLAPGGIIAFHISNLYFDLAPELGNLAQDAHLTALIANDSLVTPAEKSAGKNPSIWLAMARQPVDLALLESDKRAPFRWQPAPVATGARLWTDDYSNLLGALKPFQSQ